MNKGRRFVAAVAVSSLLAVGLPFATTRVHAAGLTTDQVSNLCTAVAEKIDNLEQGGVTRFEAFALRILKAIEAHFNCAT